MQIIFPTDFSAQSQKLLEHAIAIARSKQVGIILLYIYQLDTPDHRLSEEVLAQKVHQQEIQIHQNLATFRKTIPSDISISHVIRRTNQVTALKIQGNESPFDWFVMTSHPSQTFRDYLFGNPVEELLEKIHNNILLIPENHLDHYKPFKHIAYATNFMDDNLLSLEELNQFATCCSASITILHIDNHITEQDQQTTFRYMKVYKKIFTVPIELKVIEHQKVMTAIQEFVQNHQVDLLAMLKKKRSFSHKLFHNSITQKMVAQGAYPLLILQEKTTEGN